MGFYHHPCNNRIEANYEIRLFTIHVTVAQEAFLRLPSVKVWTFDPMMLRMYCIDTKALVFMFNGGSPYGFTIHPIFTNHINNEKHVHHAFLTPRPYLCSTSLSITVSNFHQNIKVHTLGCGFYYIYP